MARPGRRSIIYGEATTADGRGLPVTVDGRGGLIDQAGIQPTELDEAIGSLIKLCEDGGELLSTSGPMLDALMKRVDVEAKKALARIEQLSAEEDARVAKGEATTIPGINDMLARALDVANRVTIIMDRVNKMLLNAVKAKDTAVRLRTFVATGDEQDRGINNMSENALRRLVNATLAGDQLPAEDRRG